MDEITILKKQLEIAIDALHQLRDYELDDLDISWDEYETNCIDTEYSRQINLIEDTLDKIKSYQ